MAQGGGALLQLYISLYLPYISLYLPTSPYISLYLPYISQGGGALLEPGQLLRSALGRSLGIALRRAERELALRGLLPRLPRLRLRRGLGLG